jgi:hypothetical protein
VSVVIVVYSTGTISSKFFDELAAVLDCFGVYTEPIYITGEFSIQFVKRNDPYNADQMRHRFSCYGLVWHETGSTHQRGGTIVAVIAREGDAHNVNVADVGVSDHFLLHWNTPGMHAVPSLSSVFTRPWRRLSSRILPILAHFDFFTPTSHFPYLLPC